MSTNTAFAEAIEALLSGDLDRAQTLFVTILEREPTHELAHSGLKNVVQDRVVRGRPSLAPVPAVAEGRKPPGGVAEFLAALAPRQQIVIPLTRALRLAVPLAGLSQMKLAPADAFILSRLAAGKLSAGEIAHLVDRPEADLLPALERFLRDGWIAFA